MAGNYLRGAFIQYNNSFPLPVPNLILFQYNPETMTHTWTPAQAGGSNSAGQSPSNPLAVIGPPEESFSFNLVMDSNDTIADNTPGAAQLANVSGVRLTGSADSNPLWRGSIRCRCELRDRGSYDSGL